MIWFLSPSLHHHQLVCLFLSNLSKLWEAFDLAVIQLPVSVTFPPKIHLFISSQADTNCSLQQTSLPFHQLISKDLLCNIKQITNNYNAKKFRACVHLHIPNPLNTMKTLPYKSKASWKVNIKPLNSSIKELYLQGNDNPH